MVFVMLNGAKGIALAFGLRPTWKKMFLLVQPLARLIME